MSSKNSQISARYSRHSRRKQIVLLNGRRFIMAVYAINILNWLHNALIGWLE